VGEGREDRRGHERQTEGKQTGRRQTDTQTVRKKEGKFTEEKVFIKWDSTFTAKKIVIEEETQKSTLLEIRVA
jgi:hypothetical protein